MELTWEQANILINTPKMILINGIPLKTHCIDTKFPYTERIILLSKDGEFIFLWEINQSKKNKTRISLHYQEDDAKIPLLRIDYNGGHNNPQMANNNVPKELLPYVGKCFSINEPHIHFFVEGFRALDWAAPLCNIDFIPQNIIDNADFNNNFAEAIRSFAKYINIQTELSIDQPLL